MGKFWFTLKELGVQTGESLFYLNLPSFFFFLIGSIRPWKE